MASEMIRVTRSPDETFDLGRELASRFQAGDVVILTGSLGAGKTALVRGIAAGLGVKSQVSSPTFTILHIHEPGQAGGLSLHHFDAYRLTGPQDFYDNGLDELIGGRSVSVLEWGDRVRESLPLPLIEIRVSYGEDADQREFRIHFPSRDEKS